MYKVDNGSKCMLYAAATMLSTSCGGVHETTFVMSTGTKCMCPLDEGSVVLQHSLGFLEFGIKSVIE